MPATFTIVVDLTAPVVTWGAPSGTVAGEVLRIPYTLDEPELISATLELPDGRVLPFTIQAGWIEVELPIDTTAGPGRVTAIARDDVDNETTYEEVVALQGVLQPPTPGPPGGRPPGIATRPRRFITTRSSARARDADEVQRRPTRIRTRHRTASYATARVFLRTREGLQTGDGGYVIALVGGRSASRAAPGDTRLHRGVGESITQALLLDLL